ncbi:hypothetical protein [Georgenia satyanarayanai]|uniref:hypothetical protein n=1 Tax=Georgenia satyanarayanai TaxID=860221 RepID=UPI001263EDE4|nr:hypothetical protein [Georgenia satyanarayanai]
MHGAPELRRDPTPLRPRPAPAPSRPALGPLVGLQRLAGNRAVSRLVAQRSWLGDRVAWVRTATAAGNWRQADPPGAYYVLNGLSMDDMVRLLRQLSAGERKQLAANLEEEGGGFDRPRIHLALTNASAAGATSAAFREMSEKLLWAIRSGDFTSAPDGAFPILGRATPGQLAGLVTALNRDALDALIDRRDDARGIPGADSALVAVERKRGGTGPSTQDQRLIDLVEGGAWADFFRAFNGMQEFDQLRFLRGAPGVVPRIRDNLRAADGIGDPDRIRYLLERATTSTARSLYVDATVRTVSWQPKYRVADPRDLSRIVRFGNLFDVEIDISSISDDSSSPEEAELQFQQATPGPGGFLWPAVRNRSTLPVLWQVKQEVRKAQETVLFDDVLRDGIFVVQFFLDVVIPIAHGSTIRSLTALRGATLSSRWMRGAQVVKGRMPPPTPGSGYATSLGELAEGPILRRDYPNARSAPPKFKAYDGVEGGVATEELTFEGPRNNRVTIVNQTIKGGRWISIKTVKPENANAAGVQKAVRGALNDMYADVHNPSSRMPSRDPDPLQPNVYYRMLKASPDRVTLHVELPTKLTPELEAAARQVVKESTAVSELPPFDLVIRGLE